MSLNMNPGAACNLPPPIALPLRSLIFAGFRQSSGGRCVVGRWLAWVCVGVLTCPVWAQDSVPELELNRGRLVPPAYQERGEPNPAYGSELEKRVKALLPVERKAFFRHLRKQQRELGRRVEEMVFNYEKAKSLRHEVQEDSAGIVALAGEMVAHQRETILKYKEIQHQIDQVRLREDAQLLDADDFRADLYAGLQFSNLYSEGQADSSFFSTSKPFVTLDLRNTFRWPGQERWLDFFGDLSFQSASKEDSSAVNIITTSGNFSGEMGLWWMQALTERVSWGAIASMGLLGYTQPTSAAGLSSTTRDQFQSTYTLGATLRQEEGAMRGSFAEIAYQRDPLFLHPNRLVMRGQVVLTQFGSKGSNGDFYMEGLASKGPAGRDEAILLFGIRLSTVSFFQSLGAGN